MQREGISRNTFVKGVAAVVVVACSLGALRYASYSTADKAKKHSFVPGTYTAVAAGMESDVIVTITVDSTSITDVSVDVSGETQGIGAAIGDEVSAQILEAQNPEIEGVSGASVSSGAAASEPHPASGRHKSAAIVKTMIIVFQCFIVSPSYCCTESLFTGKVKYVSG